MYTAALSNLSEIVKMRYFSCRFSSNRTSRSKNGQFLWLMEYLRVHSFQTYSPVTLNGIIMTDIKQWSEPPKMWTLLGPRKSVMIRDVS